MASKAQGVTCPPKLLSHHIHRGDSRISPQPGSLPTCCLLSLVVPSTLQTQHIPTWTHHHFFPCERSNSYHSFAEKLNKSMYFSHLVTLLTHFLSWYKLKMLSDFLPFCPPFILPGFLVLKFKFQSSVFHTWP